MLKDDHAANTYKSKSYNDGNIGFKHRWWKKKQLMEW